MTIAIIIFGLFLWVLAFVLGRWAIQTWRGGGRPASERMRNSSFRDEESLAAQDRTGFVMSAMFASMGIAAMCTAIGGINFTRSGPWLWIAGAAVFVFLVCTLLYALIVNFNQPKFLVPPSLRDEMGARASRRLRNRRWRDL
jgi:hypothetical protein